jgi:hypothetical protein
VPIFFVPHHHNNYEKSCYRSVQLPQGVQWLTVPVKVTGKYHQTIRETEIDGSKWAEAHWNAFARNYRRASHFDEVAAFVEPLYRQRQYTHLSTLNQEFIKAVCAYLGIATKISHSWDYALINGKTERLADLCRKAGGTEYISGPAAKEYIEEHIFVEQGITITWFDYAGYEEYPQLWGKFIHGVTILDLLFNCGKESLHYMKFASR